MHFKNNNQGENQMSFSTTHVTQGIRGVGGMGGIGAPFVARRKRLNLPTRYAKSARCCIP